MQKDDDCYDAFLFVLINESWFNKSPTICFKRAELIAKTGRLL